MLNNGHSGPVRFITSVEVPKNANSQAANEVARDSSYPLVKTVVISGGEGNEVYKSTGMTSVHHNHSMSSNSVVLSNQSSDSGINGSSDRGSFSNGSGSQSQQGGNNDDNLPGKDDLINYVLAWEI